MTAIDTPSRSSTRFFDQDGRRIVRNLSTPAHRAVRRRFICNQPAIDHAAIHDRITRHLDCHGALSVAEFEGRAQTILQQLNTDPRCADIVNAVAVPFFLPRTPRAASHDLGIDLEHVYLPAVGLSFHEASTGGTFVNHHRTGLAGKLGLAAGSRHERLLHAMEAGVTVGYLFLSLTEFSIPAAVEQLSELPSNISLAGGADLCAALIGSPHLLLRIDGYPPLVWLAGLHAEVESAGYHFEAYGYGLTFNRRVHLNQAAEYWACALTVLE